MHEYFDFDWYPSYQEFIFEDILLQMSRVILTKFLFSICFRTHFVQDRYMQSAMYLPLYPYLYGY